MRFKCSNCAVTIVSPSVQLVQLEEIADGEIAIKGVNCNFCCYDNARLLLRGDNEAMRFVSDSFERN